MRVRSDGSKRRKLAKSCALIAADARGAAILEFALVAAPLLALLLAIIETSLVFFTQQSIETATEVTARALMTGSAQSANLSPAQFKQIACNALPGYLDCSNLYVDVQTAASFSAANTSAPTLTYDKNGNVTNNFSYATGGAGDIVVVRLTYLWPVVTGPLGFDLSDQPNSRRMIIGTSVAKTEPYS